MPNGGMTLDRAQRLVAAVLVDAQAQGVAIAAGVIDVSGALVAFARVDGAGRETGHRVAR